MSDFIRDFHFGDERDDRDYPFNNRVASVEMSECNKAGLRSAYREVRDRGGAILEVGVHRNGRESSTWVLLDEKLDSSIYIGVDLEDKSFLDSSSV
jgi:hypothetical protein